jgi:FMN-dependent oxidoreductase (nitrilotriacetate monooxygenase family)
MKKHLCLGGFMRPICLHTAWWRHPSAPAHANFHWPTIKSLAQKLEHACFDAIFTADHLALMPMPPSALRRSATVTSYDPLVMLSAIAACTEHIGLIATGSTSYEDPYLLARRFASLDHLSNGRAGWNIVTTVNPQAAHNFGLDTALRHGERYARAEEFFKVTTGLWDGWSDNALVMDKESGIFSDLDKIQPLNHQGDFFSVQGPLNIARPVQGWPVIALAGASEGAREMAARSADLVFGNARSLETGQQFYRDVKNRARAWGRDPSAIKILPANQVYVGATHAEALAKKRYMDNLVHIESNIPNLSIRLGVDCSKFDPDKLLPDLPATEQGQGNQREWVALARREKLTVRELAKRAAESGTGEMVGTPTEIADQMEAWLMEEACDGFIIVFHTVPDGYEDFTTLVVPELQRRGLMRTQYTGNTLRENIGLPRPISHLDK